MKLVRSAAIASAVGIVAELVSLRWAHPTAFLLFAGVSGLAFAVAIALLLWMLFVTGPKSPTS